MSPAEEAGELYKAIQPLILEACHECSRLGLDLGYKSASENLTPALIHACQQLSLAGQPGKAYQILQSVGLSDPVVAKAATGKDQTEE